MAKRPPPSARGTPQKRRLDEVGVVSPGGNPLMPDNAQAEHPIGEPSPDLYSDGAYGNEDYERDLRHYGDNVGKHNAGRESRLPLRPAAPPEGRAEAELRSRGTHASSRWSGIGGAALVSGSIASVVSGMALAALARAEGASAAQPLNATSHWLHGDRAGAVRRTDVRHTGIGYATHHASSVFWALLFEILRRRPVRADLNDMVRAAMATAATAAVVDYGLMPRRLRPGWRLAISRPSLAAVFAALAGGLVIGGLASSRLRR